MRRPHCVTVPPAPVFFCGFLKDKNLATKKKNTHRSGWALAARAKPITTSAPTPSSYRPLRLFPKCSESAMTYFWCRGFVGFPSRSSLFSSLLLDNDMCVEKQMRNCGVAVGRDQICIVVPCCHHRCVGRRLPVQPLPPNSARTVSWCIERTAFAKEPLLPISTQTRRR